MNSEDGSTISVTLVLPSDGETYTESDGLKKNENLNWKDVLALPGESTFPSKYEVSSVLQTSSFDASTRRSRSFVLGDSMVATPHSPALKTDSSVEANCLQPFQARKKHASDSGVFQSAFNDSYSDTTSICNMSKNNDETKQVSKKCDFGFRTSDKNTANSSAFQSVFADSDSDTSVFLSKSKNNSKLNVNKKCGFSSRPHRKSLEASDQFQLSLNSTTESITDTVTDTSTDHIEATNGKLISFGNDGDRSAVFASTIAASSQVDTTLKRNLSDFPSIVNATSTDSNNTIKSDKKAISLQLVNADSLDFDQTSTSLNCIHKSSFSKNAEHPPNNCTDTANAADSNNTAKSDENATSMLSGNADSLDFDQTSTSRDCIHKSSFSKNAEHQPTNCTYTADSNNTAKSDENATSILSFNADPRDIDQTNTSLDRVHKSSSNKNIHRPANCTYTADSNNTAKSYENATSMLSINADSLDFEQTNISLDCAHKSSFSKNAEHQPNNCTYTKSPVEILTKVSALDMTYSVNSNVIDKNISQQRSISKNYEALEGSLANKTNADELTPVNVGELFALPTRRTSSRRLNASILSQKVLVEETSVANMLQQTINGGKSLSMDDEKDEFQNKTYTVQNSSQTHTSSLLNNSKINAHEKNPTNDSLDLPPHKLTSNVSHKQRTHTSSLPNNSKINDDEETPTTETQHHPTSQNVTCNISYKRRTHTSSLLNNLSTGEENPTSESPDLPASQNVITHISHKQRANTSNFLNDSKMNAGEENPTNESQDLLASENATSNISHKRRTRTSNLLNNSKMKAGEENPTTESQDLPANHNVAINISHKQSDSPSLKIVNTSKNSSKSGISNIIDQSEIGKLVNNSTFLAGSHPHGRVLTRSSNKESNESENGFRENTVSSVRDYDDISFRCANQSTAKKQNPTTMPPPKFILAPLRLCKKKSKLSHSAVKNKIESHIKVLEENTNRKDNDQSKDGQKQKMKQPLEPTDAIPKLLIDSELYRNRTLNKPTKWANADLYKFVIDKLYPEFNIRSRVEAEKFVIFLCDKCKEIVQTKSDFSKPANELMVKMAQLQLVETELDFHRFVFKYLPREVLKKTVPCIGIFGRPPLVPWAEGSQFGKIVYKK